MAAVRQRETVQLRKDAQVDVPEFRFGLGRLLVPDVADPLEEQEREDVALPVRSVDRAAAQDLRAVPEVGLQLLEGQWTRGHRRPEILYSLLLSGVDPLTRHSLPGRSSGLGCRFYSVPGTRFSRRSAVVSPAGYLPVASSHASRRIFSSSTGRYRICSTLTFTSRARQQGVVGVAMDIDAAVRHVPQRDVRHQQWRVAVGEQRRVDLLESFDVELAETVDVVVALH